jgi:hypothetical protein
MRIMAKANKRKAVEFVKHAFGVDAKVVWSNDEEVYLKFDTQQRNQMNLMAQHASEFFGSRVQVNTKKSFGTRERISVEFDGHMVKCTKYAGTPTIGVTLINSNFLAHGGYAFDTL